MQDLSPADAWAVMHKFISLLSAPIDGGAVFLDSELGAQPVISPLLLMHVLKVHEALPPFEAWLVRTRLVGEASRSPTPFQPMHLDVAQLTTLVSEPLW